MGIGSKFEEFDRRTTVRFVAILIIAVIGFEFFVTFWSRGLFRKTRPEDQALQDDASRPETGFVIDLAYGKQKFERPTDIKHAGDSRLFVAEQGGIVKVFSQDKPEDTAEVALDISSEVRAGGDQGLMGIAFHPRFAKNGQLYLFYNAKATGSSTIARYSQLAGEKSRFDPTSQEIIFTGVPSSPTQRGAGLAFGPDGYLYFGLGDGGVQGDPQNNAQNPKSLLGKVLRLDVDSVGPNANYAVPTDNPFANDGEGRRGEIFALGFRNPRGLSFHQDSKTLWVIDGGAGQVQEVNIVERGKNYGWNVVQGIACFNTSGPCKKEDKEIPIFMVKSEDARSLMSGVVYLGNRVRQLTGKFIYADFSTGNIWGGLSVGGQTENILLARSGLHISSVGVDSRNELLLVSQDDGQLYRLKPRA